MLKILENMLDDLIDDAKSIYDQDVLMASRARRGTEETRDKIVNLFKVYKEKPINCSGCSFWENSFLTDYNVFCMLNWHIVKEDEFSARPRWCPLDQEEE